uniref:hypothetical protein n=1 Tax=Enterococcus faecium TaxID=1352 RepID=UPI003F816C7D
KQKKDLIIHCYMGVSRSGAVAKWVNDHYGLEKPELENYTLYNKRVYSMLMNVTSGCIDIKNSMFGGE